MRLNTYLLALLFLCLSPSAFGQLSDGSEAPDFILTDIEGNTHHLHDLLAQGKTVVLDFSATWCGPCWNYHNTGAMSDFYYEYGPNGSDEGMTFFIESDLSTGLDDLNGETSQTQGDWVEGTPYPIIDLQSSEVSNAYNINYYPTIYEVCPDGLVYEVGQASGETLGNWIQSCTFEVSLGNITNTVCYGEGEGQVEAAATGGYGTPNYNWSNGSTDPIMTGVEAGYYSVNISDDNGRVEQITNIYVDGPEDPIEIFYNEITDLECNGDASGTIAVEAEGGNGISGYTWSNGETTALIEDLAAGVYEVTVTDANGCEISGSFEVMEPTVLESTGSSETAFCGNSDGSITFSAWGGTGPYIVSCPTGVVDMENGIITGLATGNHEVFVEDANGCETSFEQFVEDAPGPELILSTPNTLTCMDSEAMITSTVNYEGTDLSYTWFGPNGLIAGAVDPQLMVTEPGEYTLVVEDILHGCEAEDFVIVLADIDLPEVTVPDALTLDCDNLEIHIPATVSNAGDEADINWTTADGNITFGQGTSTIAVDAPGTYVVAVTNSETGCSASSEIVISDERSYPTANFGFETEELTAVFSNMSTGEAVEYIWDFGDGNVSNEESPSHTFSMNGIYAVCLTTKNNCGTETTCFDVLVEAAAGAIQVGYVVSHVTCAGDANASISLTIAGGVAPYSFEWTGPNGFTTTTADITDLSAGVYIVLIEDSNGTQTQVQIFVNEPEVLDYQTTVESDLWGYSIDLEVSGGTAPYSYNWNNGMALEDLSNLPEGEYTCEVVDANGCLIQTETIVIGPAFDSPGHTEWQRDIKHVSLEGNPGVQPLKIHIGGSELNTEYNYQLVNVAGMVLASGQWTGNYHSADLRGQMTGIYILVIRDDHGWIQSEKIFIGQ